MVYSFLGYVKDAKTISLQKIGLAILNFMDHLKLQKLLENIGMCASKV